ncbi:MAG: PKD domain-containing protein, partial [Dehalococcoidia bacterium]
MRSIVGSRVLWLALIAALAAGIWQLSAGEHTQAYPLDIVLKTNQLSVDHIMDFDTLFPGESIEGKITVSLTGTTVDSSTVSWGGYTGGKAAYLDFSLSECRADFTADNLSFDVNTMVQFSDNSSGDISSWSWDFDGDGIIDSTEKNPSHIFTTDGIYSVSLAVSGANCEDTMIRNDYIHVAPARSCRADFTVDKTTADVNVRLKFSDRSQGDVTGWAWDFDDDGVVYSNEQNPTHIFKREGLYSVSLTVFGPDCQHTLSRTG